MAEVAPAFVGQFGPNINVRNFKAALEELGFSETYEVALGADIGAIAEAHHYVNKVTTGELPFLLTSCCPSWAMLAKKFFPETIDKISNELTPMVATARVIKKEHPDASVVFIGPCASKKLEASRRSVRSDVDFVITFEELTGMFEAKGILLDEIQAMDTMADATAAGRGYGVAGGVASAIEGCIKEYYPDTEIHIEHAEIGRDIQVKAGAGTGKTYSMVSRVAFLCSHASNSGVFDPAAEIAMLTFTDDAAINMKSRLKQLFVNYFILTNDTQYLEW